MPTMYISVVVIGIRSVFGCRPGLLTGRKLWLWMVISGMGVLFGLAAFASSWLLYQNACH